jgi:hypothetical protein
MVTDNLGCPSSAPRAPFPRKERGEEAGGQNLLLNDRMCAARPRPFRLSKKLHSPSLLPVFHGAKVPEGRMRG